MKHNGTKDVLWFSAAGVDSKDAAVVGRPINKQHVADDTKSLG